MNGLNCSFIFQFYGRDDEFKKNLKKLKKWKRHKIYIPSKQEAVKRNCSIKDYP